MSIYIEGLSSFSGLDMDFRTDFYLTQAWNVTGHRCEEYAHFLLEHNVSYADWETQGGFIPIPPNYFHHFWHPDTWLINGKVNEVSSHLVNTRSLRLKQQQTGGQVKSKSQVCNLEFIGRYTAVVGCQFDFRDYPGDTQECVMRFRSYAFNSQMVRYEWMPAKVNHANEIKLLRHTHEILPLEPAEQQVLGKKCESVHN